MKNIYKTLEFHVPHTYLPLRLYVFFTTYHQQHACRKMYVNIFALLADRVWSTTFVFCPAQVGSYQ